MVPLFILRDASRLEVVSEMDQFRLKPTDRLVALVGPARSAGASSPRARSAALVDEAPGDVAFEVEDARDGDGSSDGPEERPS